MLINIMNKCIIYLIAFFLISSLNSEKNQTSLFQDLSDKAFYSVLEIMFKSQITDCTKIFADECNFWQIGNTIDTITDYLRQNPNNAPVFYQYLTNSYKKSSARINNMICWYDDYGWWAVGTQRLLGFTELFPDPQIRSQIEEISRATYADHQTSIDIWDFCTYDQECMSKFSSFEPLFQGGVWNYFWTDKVVPGLCSTPCNPLDDKNTLCGIQNTVTNALFALSSSLRVKTMPTSPYFKQSYLRIKQFFDNWMNIPFKDLSIIKYLTADQTSFVFRERVSSFKNGSKSKFFSEDLSWAGDNGLMLGYFVALSENQAELRPLIINLLDGIKAYFVDHEETLIYPWANGLGNVGPPPGGDFGDYNTGIGILVRNLRTAYDSSEDMKKIILDKFKKVILNFASLLLKTDNFICYGDCGELTKNANKSQILTFAIELLKEETREKEKKFLENIKSN